MLIDPDTESIGSPQWYQTVIAAKLGYERLRDWQVDLSMEVAAGQDVVLVAGTGMGKSAMLHVPATTAKVRNGRVLVMSIAPTKTLCDDQARAANARGLRAVAIHSDSLRLASAESPARNLFQEVCDDQWDLFIVPPELLLHPELEWLFRSQTDPQSEVATIDLVFVDECHLVHKQGELFRVFYKHIGNLRGRLPASIPWIAVTATLPPGKIFDAVMKSLGFIAGDYTIKRLRVDVPNIKYIPRFLRYTISGSTMYDLAWLIPMNVTVPSDIQKTIVFCETIELASRVLEFLESLLPSLLPNRNETIMPFYSLLSADYRSTYVHRLRTGTTRILVGTDCLTYGLDVPDIAQVVLLGLCPTYSRMTQEIGRAGRNGLPARAITYAPMWVKITSVEKGTKQEALDKQRRDEMCPSMLAWYNGTEERCPRQVACELYGDSFEATPHCCIFHEPEDADELEVARRLVDVEKMLARNGRLRSDGTHHTLDKTLMYPAAQRIIRAWSNRTWASLRGNQMHLPYCVFFPTHLRDRLCDKLHMVTSLERLQALLHDWSYLQQFGSALWDICHMVLVEFDKVWKDRAEAVAQTPPASITSLPDIAGQPRTVRLILRNDENTPPSLVPATATSLKHPQSPQKPRNVKRICLSDKWNVG